MTTKPSWVDGPFALISSSQSGDGAGKTLRGARFVAAHMSMIHNWLLRGANAVYLQCVNVSTRGTDQDKLDFANFAYQWAQLVFEHHDAEENIIFPGINEVAGVPGLMDGNVQEHQVFHHGMETYAEYLKGVKEGKEKLDGEKVKSIMDSFMPALHTHLVNEIDTLVQLEKYEDKVEWDKWFQEQAKALGKQSMGEANFRENLFAFLLVFHDKSFEDGVWSDHPPMPWIVLVVLRWMFVSKHANWWRFAGCDTASNPQELPFV